MATYRIENVRVFDGDTTPPNPCTVCVSGSIITYVGDNPPSDTPSDVKVISGENCTLLPGLIDAHTHIFRSLDGLKQCIPMGVTTVFDMHNEPDNVKYMKEESRKSAALPDVLSAYHAATVKDGWPRAIVKRHAPSPEASCCFLILKSLDGWPTLTTTESIEEYVVKNKALGADFIKLMQETGECLNFESLNAPTGELQAAVIKSAHKHGLLTVAHATNLRETMLVLQAGVDGLAHQFFDKPHTKELIEAYKEHDAFIIPTLTAVNSMIGVNSSVEFAEDQRALKVLSESTKACLCDHMSIALPYCDTQYAYDCVMALKAAGIDVVCGTDSATGIQGTALGTSLHHELSLYVRHCQFSPVEALRTATSVAARRFKLKDRGIIAEGKRADLLLVRGNPTENIGDTLNIEGVWRLGVHYSPIK